MGAIFAFSADNQLKKEERRMLRITHASGRDGKSVIRLEGKLLQPWVVEVRSLSTPPKPDSFPSFDLSGLTFVDDAGTNLLQQLLRQGVPIAFCSPFVAALLRLNESQQP